MTESVLPRAFLKGRLISLRLPSVEKDVLNGVWHDWFNDYRITEYLEHGAYPISREQQADFVTDLMRKKNALALAIDDNETSKHVGVISLKSIDHFQAKAEIAIVMGGKSRFGSALEAMALLTDHAFSRLNLNKLYAGQHEDLWKWVNTLALVGYRIEGYRDFWGRRNGRNYGVVITGIDSETYFNLKADRGGDILMGDPGALAKTRSGVNFTKPLQTLLQEINSSVLKCDDDSAA
jgi:ribosomal-protein-alanine N-acetyltransferase